MKKSENDIVFETFKQLIEEKGFDIAAVDESGLIHIAHEGGKFHISLDNVRKRYAEDNDIAHIEALVETVVEFNTPIPGWEDAKDKVMISLFASGFDAEDVPFEKVTTQCSKIFVYYTSSKIQWISNHQIEDWGIDLATLQEQAAINMAEVAEATEFVENDIEDKVLILLHTPAYESFRAALLFTDSMRKVLKAHYGLPVYAVAPTRDSCYIFKDVDKDFFIERFGGIVMREYEEYGHPLTPEILEINDSETVAVGAYQFDD